MVMKSNDIHIMAISETHLDASFENIELAVEGYTLCRKDISRYGGGVALYVQNHIPVKVRNYLMMDDIEALWIQVHLPQTKPILVGCCYRPPSADIKYLDLICEMLDKSSDENREI